MATGGKVLEFFGHVNFIRQYSKLVPAEIAFANIHYPNQLFVITVDLSREEFTSKDCHVNECLATAAHRLKWPHWPPRHVHTTLDQLDSYLREFYDNNLYEQFGNFVAVKGDEQAAFFESRVPTVNVQEEMRLPAMTVLKSVMDRHPPRTQYLNEHAATCHRHKNIALCSGTIAWYNARYLQRRMLGWELEVSFLGDLFETPPESNVFFPPHPEAKLLPPPDDVTKEIEKVSAYLETLRVMVEPTSRRPSPPRLNIY